MAALPCYISVTEAAERLGLPTGDLYRMVDTGKIKAAEINGETVVSEESVEKRIPRPSQVKKEELPEYKKYSHLQGNKLGVNEASRKYGVPNPTISRWRHLGYIKKIDQKGQKVLLDEQDVACCADIYRQNGGQGKWLFNPDGTPYEKSKN